MITNDLQQQHLFNKLTTYYKQSLILAYKLSRTKSKQQIESDDLLMAILQQKGSLGYEAMVKAGIKPSRTKAKSVNKKLSISEKDIIGQNQLVLSATVQKIIVESVAIAARYEHNYVGTEHLLYSLIKLKDNKIDKILNRYKVRPQKIKWLDIKKLRGKK